MSKPLQLLGGSVAGIVLVYLMFFRGSPTDNTTVRAATWNIAAINNNPFEYWITHDDPAYNKMMADVQDFIDSPGDADVPINEIFTEEMFQKLNAVMAKEGWEGLDVVEENWKALQEQRVVSGFLKDGEIGKKRLASMPDRVTNTINIDGGKTACRPTVINCYERSIRSLDDWFDQWIGFMFVKKISVTSKGVSRQVRPCEMLIPIKKAKYPAITEAEEKVSIPLQTVYGAIFDAILVHLMQVVNEKSWQGLRSEMCAALNHHKNDNILHILKSEYKDRDVIFLQEVAAAFIAKAQKSLGGSFKVFSSGSLDGKRDQNSVILLRKSYWDLSTINEVTDKVTAKFDADVPVANGDVLAIEVKDNSGTAYFLASFHGDTNGLATIPVVTAVQQTAKEPEFASHRLVFGLDANTYESGDADRQDVTEFSKSYLALGLSSVWGDMPNPKNHTTFNARTFLQPQLNKAVKMSEKELYGDKNPKDFIVFWKDQFTPIGTTKDNTGKREYVEQMVFPTLQFPSDHGILSSNLETNSDTSISK